MRSATIISLLSLFFSLGPAQVNQTPAPQPNKLEALAGQSTAQVKWSKEIGRIESVRDRVVVTALVVNDEVHHHRMRGIRLDLTSQNAADRVYLDELELELVKKALEGIESGIESFRTERGGAPLRYLGSCELREPSATVHLSAAYYIAPDSSGLSLSAFKQQEFRFPNHRPSELAAAFGRAIDELKHH